MATGDITVTVLPDGCSLRLDVAGFTTGCTYAFGYTGNNVPGASTPYCDVVSLGFTGGVADTKTRRVYLVPGVARVRRFPFSTASINGAFAAGTFVSGETVTASISLRTAVIVEGFSQSSGTKLFVRNVSGATNAADVWTGGTSGATFNASATHSVLAANTPYEMATSTGVSVRVGLSRPIFQKDNTGGGNSGTAPTITIPASFITNTAGAGQLSNALTAAAVTQSSTLAYPKAKFNWLTVPNQLVGLSFNLTGTGSGFGATGGKTLDCVIFTAADTHAHTATTTVSSMTVVNDYSGPTSVLGYRGAMDATTLTALDNLTCNFKAYPLIGDSNSIRDSSAGTVQPTPLRDGPITMVNDKSSTYGITCARVSTTGNDGTGVVADVSTFNQTTAPAFLTLGGALAACAVYNNANHARNNCGGARIFCEDGTYAHFDGAHAYGSGSKVWAEIRRTTASTSRDSVIISGTSVGNSFGVGFEKYVDVKVVGATLGFGFGGASFADAFWLSGCNNTYTNASTWWDCIVYVTGGKAPTQGAGDGMIPYTTTIQTGFSLVQEVDLTGFDARILAYVAPGNFTTASPATAGILFSLKVWDTQAATQSTNFFIGFNKILKWKGNVPIGTANTGYVNSDGGLLMQNLFENIGAGGTYPLVDLGASGAATGNTPINNITFIHNTWTGERVNIAYDAFGTTSYIHTGWELINEITEYLAYKNDTYAGFSAGDGVRQGSFDLINGCRVTGVMSPQLTGLTAGSFEADFLGINSYQPTSSGQPPGGTPNVNGYVQFTNRLSWAGAAETAGGGDYTLQVTSPALNMITDWVLPKDLAGNTRGSTDSPGAFTTFVAPTSTSTRIPSIPSMPSIPSIARR